MFLFAQRGHARTELSNREVESLKGAASITQQALGKRWLQMCGRDLLGTWAGPPSLFIPANMAWHGTLLDSPGLSYSHLHQLEQVALREAGQAL